MRMLGLCLLLFMLPDARAVSASDIDLDSALGGIDLKPLYKSIGMLTNFRGYQGASSIERDGRMGLDFGIEATMVGISSDLAATMGGGGGASSSMGALPSARVHLHKALGTKAELGSSGIWYKGTYMVGGSLKFVVSEPEEGPIWAFRVSYNVSSIDLGLVGMQIPLTVDGVDLGTASPRIRTQTISPQLLVSRPLSFAEPYGGIGVDWTSGQIAVPVDVAVLGTSQTITTSPITQVGFTAFTGVVFRVPHIGLKIALDGSYSSLSTPSLGLFMGLGI